jgi:uncharacterized phiE125 gp8 family phage protein
MKTLLVTSSTGNPITLEEIKDHLRIERGETIDDDLLKNYRSAAVEMVENITNRKLMPQTWKLYLDDWPDKEYIEMPYSPLRDVATTDILYTDSTRNTTTFNLTGTSSSWALDTVSEPGRIVLDNNDDWPTDVLYQRNPIEIQFTCGYSASSNIPRSIKNAMLMMIGHFYENREDTMVGQELKYIPMASRALLASYRIPSF